MIFCGQCGLQLAPGDTRCPRCGAVVEPDAQEAVDPSTIDYRPDDQTMASPSLLARKPGQVDAPTTRNPQATPDPQQLILRPGMTGYEQNPDAPTSMMDSQRIGTTPTRAYPGGQPSQQSGYYPTQQDYNQYSGVDQGYAGGYPGQYYPEQYQQEPAPRKNSGRSAGLIFILLGVLLVLTAIILFLLVHSGVIGSANNGNTAIASTSTATNNKTPEQAAKDVVQRYYDSVNNKDYQTAYHLWKNNKQDFTEFKNGYKNTLQDTVTFDSVVKQPDGKMRVNITLDATESVKGKTRHTTYLLYYLIEKQPDGTWLIFDGDNR